MLEERFGHCAELDRELALTGRVWGTKRAHIVATVQMLLRAKPVSMSGRLAEAVLRRTVRRLDNGMVATWAVYREEGYVRTLKWLGNEIE